jgi:hypothetical protein
VDNQKFRFLLTLAYIVLIVYNKAKLANMRMMEKAGGERRQRRMK